MNMHRPVMNPSFFENPGPSQNPGGRLRALWQVLRKLVGLLFTDLLARLFRREEVKDEVGTRGGRLMRRIAYRLLFVPMLLMAVAATLVFFGTHPPRISTPIDPTSDGIYHDAIDFLSKDGVRLEAWLVPVIDARRVLEEKEAALRTRHPAVVLVHDYGAAPDQMLPLVRPLHQSGMVVLVVGLRGSGTSERAGQTFGLKESDDVQAAVSLLRRRQEVDQTKIALVGIGTGATAALLAADRDPALAAVVVDTPLKDFSEALAGRLGPKHPVLQWMRPLCKWTFQIAYRVDTNEVQFDRFSRMIESRPVLVMDSELPGSTLLRPPGMQQAMKFLQQHLKNPDAAVAGAQ